ncbi:MAG: FUSC family protein, partial [Candidatus Latescibacterota bacterium]
TVVMVWLAYGIFPDPVGLSAQNTAPASAQTPNEAERVRDSLLSTVVVLPVMVLFYCFEFVSSLLVLIFIALLSMQPSFAKNFKAGFALIIGNVIGGVAAIVFYNLLVIVPEFVFLIVLTLLAGLVFGTRVFSGKKTAPLYGMAFSTVLLVIGSVTSSTDDAGSKVYTRIAQIMLAVAYVVAAFGIIERIEKRRAGAA